MGHVLLCLVLTFLKPGWREALLCSGFGWTLLEDHPILLHIDFVSVLREDCHPLMI